MTVDPVGVLDTSTLVRIDRIDPNTLPEELDLTYLSASTGEAGRECGRDESGRVSRGAERMRRAASRATGGVGMRGQAGVGAIPGEPGSRVGQAAPSRLEGSQKLNSDGREPATIE